MQLEDVYKLMVEMSGDIGHIKGKVESIEEQVRKTNGRVTELEKEDTKQQVSWAKISTLGVMAMIAIELAISWLRSKF